MRRFYWRAVSRAAVFVASVTIGSTGVHALDAEGLWIRDDGATKIQFAPCGAALCGAVVWLKNPNSKARIGQQVFFDMVRADQNSWTGQALNPDDGKTYSGKMVVNGKKLRTSGCVLGGLICKTMNWVRSN